jgi:patatin-like phospholipase/acyl hydrolase
VLAELEARVKEEAGEEVALSDCFHLLAGTSTGGLIALGLTVPNRQRPPRPRLSADDLVRLYRDEGPRIFARSLWQRVRTLGGWVGPKYSTDALKEVTEERFGDVRLRRALRELVVTSYDMRNREPHFFKRWRAAQSADRNPTMVEAALGRPRPRRPTFPRSRSATGRSSTAVCSPPTPPSPRSPRR